MKYIYWRAYWNYEKEEKWLNEMSQKGMALTDYSWCRYVFEETSSSEYTYRIELLKNMPNHPESIAYLKFLEENGVEYVASYMRWVYLRKKTSEGIFDIYTDFELKKDHYKRIYMLWIIVMCIEFSAGLLNIFLFILEFKIAETPNVLYSNLIVGILLTSIGVFFLQLALIMKNKIKRLEKEKLITE